MSSYMQSIFFYASYPIFALVYSDIYIYIISDDPELTRERSILFLSFEIKRVFVYNSTVFRLTDLFSLYFFIQNVNANKKVFKIKGYTIM